MRDAARSAKTAAEAELLLRMSSLPQRMETYTDTNSEPSTDSGASPSSSASAAELNRHVTNGETSEWPFYVDGGQVRYWEHAASTKSLVRCNAFAQKAGLKCTPLAKDMDIAYVLGLP